MSFSCTFVQLFTWITFLKKHMTQQQMATPRIVLGAQQMPDELFFLCTDGASVVFVSCFVMYPRVRSRGKASETLHAVVQMELRGRVLVFGTRNRGEQQTPACLRPNFPRARRCTCSSPSSQRIFRTVSRPGILWLWRRALRRVPAIPLVSVGPGGVPSGTFRALRC